MITIALIVTLSTLGVIAIIVDRQPKKRPKIKRQVKIKSTYNPKTHDTTTVDGRRNEGTVPEGI